VALGRVGDRDVIVSADYDGGVLIWDAATGAPIGNPLTSHTGSVAAVALGRIDDRDVIVSAGRDGTVLICDPATGATLHTADLLSPARALAVSPDGQLSVATGHAVCAFTLPPCPDGR
jgi:WD40 repeat protein